MRRIFGLDANSYQGACPPANFGRPDSPGRPPAPVWQAMPEAVAQKKPVDIECRFLSLDGSERIVHARGQLYHGQEGGAAHMLVVAQDVTEQKQAEAARRASEERFISFMKHLPANVPSSRTRTRASSSSTTPTRNSLAGRTPLARRHARYLPADDVAEMGDDDRLALAGEVVRISSESAADGSRIHLQGGEIPHRRAGRSA